MIISSSTNYFKYTVIKKKLHTTVRHKKGRSVTSAYKTKYIIIKCKTKNNTTFKITVFRDQVDECCHKCRIVTMVMISLKSEYHQDQRNTLLLMGFMHACPHALL